MKPRSARRFVVIGNPENRRVALFQEALGAHGLPKALVVRWLDLATDPHVLAEVGGEPTWLRIESAGEDFEVERAFLRRGHESARDDEPSATRIERAEIDSLREDRGRILAPRQQHQGFLAVLSDVDRVLMARPSWRLSTPTWAIRELFDKRITSRTFAGLGVPVPPAVMSETTDVDTLRASLRDARVREVYVKLSCGSSASSLALWRLGPQTDVVVTSLERAGGAYYNSLRIRRYERPADVDEVLSFLLREGSHVEVAIPKARMGDLEFDCRVLVVAGEPTFTVVRTSRHPITNLHLGGQRGDLDELRARCPPAIYAAAEESCQRIGRHYGALHVGIDLLFEAGFTGHRVVEGNAFGDLLPNLTRDGLGTYGWEIRAALAAG